MVIFNSYVSHYQRVRFLQNKKNIQDLELQESRQHALALQQAGASLVGTNGPTWNP